MYMYVHVAEQSTFCIVWLNKKKLTKILHNNNNYVILYMSSEFIHYIHDNYYVHHTSYFFSNMYTSCLYSIYVMYNNICVHVIILRTKQMNFNKSKLKQNKSKQNKCSACGLCYYKC